MKIRTTVRAVLCVAHRAPEAGILHGHTYEVWARFPDDWDARHLQGVLAAAVAVYDHQPLPDELAWGGPLSLALGRALAPYRCDYLRLERRLEGIIAEWWA